MFEENYKEKRRKRRKEFYRIRLGMLQMLRKPYLAIMILPIIFGAVFIWQERAKVLQVFDVSPLLEKMYDYIYCILAIFLPIILLIAVLESIGEITARKIEADLQETFNEKELRNGSPILVDKRRIKHTDVIEWELYSEIPLEIWEKRQNAIQDLMCVSFVDKIKRNINNSRRIILTTRKGRGKREIGVVEDDEL